jgi:hypothetical protein
MIIYTMDPLKNITPTINSISNEQDEIINMLLSMDSNCLKRMKNI